MIDDRSGFEVPARSGVLYPGKLFFPRRNSERRFDRRSSRHQSVQVTSGMSSSPLPGGNRLIFLDHSIPFYLPALLPIFLYGEINVTGILSDVELDSLFLSLTLAALLLALLASTVRVSINKIS